MYQNKFTSLLALASLAFMAAAKEKRIAQVDPVMLHTMNETDQKLYMGKDERLSILMDKSEGWNLYPLLGSAYSVHKRFQCSMNYCDIAWDIKYSDLNSQPANVNTVLIFRDAENHEVSVGLRINASGLRGGLNPCTEEQAEDV